MLTSDIDRALDTRLVIAYRGNSAISEFSEKSGIVFHGGLFLGDGNLEVSCFIPSKLKKNREVSIFLAQNKIRRFENVYALNFSFPNATAYEAVFNSFQKDRSVVLDSLSISGGVYYVSFRMLSAGLWGVSDLWLKHSATQDGLGISYLGRNPGVSEVIEEVSRNTPLKRFAFTFRVPEDIRESKIFNALGGEWVSEARFSSSSKNFSNLVMTDRILIEPEKSGINVVSPEKKLYEATLDLPLMSAYFQGCFENRILRTLRTMHYMNGRMEVSTLVPEIQSSVYLGVIANASKEFPDYDLTFRTIDPLGQ